MLLQFRADFRSKTRPTTVPQTTSLKKSKLTILMCKLKNEINISRVKSLSMAFDTCCTARYSKTTCTAFLHWSTIGDGQAIRRTTASKSRCPANCLSDPAKLPWIYCTRLVKHLVTPTTITRQTNAGFNEFLSPFPYNTDRRDLDLVQHYPLLIETTNNTESIQFRYKRGNMI